MGNGVVVSWKVTIDAELEEAEPAIRLTPKSRSVVTIEPPKPSKEHKKQSSRARVAR